MPGCVDPRRWWRWRRPALVAGSLLLHGRTVRRLLPVVERLTYLSKLPRRLLRPPGRVRKAALPENLPKT